MSHERVTLVSTLTSTRRLPRVAGDSKLTMVMSNETRVLHTDNTALQSAAARMNKHVREAAMRS